METFFSGPGRGWFTRLFGRNPLVRSSDRVEAFMLVVGIVLVLLAAPIAGAVGTAVYSSRAGVYEQQVRTRHTVAATVLADSTSTVRPYTVSFDVRARWQDRGVQHEELLGWDRPANAGDRLSIWVNDKGDYAGPPTGRKRAVSDAIIAGAVRCGAVAVGNRVGGGRDRARAVPVGMAQARPVGSRFTRTGR